jgi:nucleoside-diphosphate-sugar epimerase
VSRRILVTGATGFVGTHLTRRFADDGWDVSALVRPQSDVDRLDPRVTAYAPYGDTATLVSAIVDARPDVVIHLASLFIAEHAPDQVGPLVESNVLFGAQLLEAMDAAGVDALVNTGTSWQYFDGVDYDPVCLYAATKQAFEDIALFYVSARGLRMQTLRLYDTYGPDDPRPKLFHALRAAAETGVTLRMSPGEQIVDMLHVDDVVAALRIAVVSDFRCGSSSSSGKRSRAAPWTSNGVGGRTERARSCLLGTVRPSRAGDPG